MLGERLSDAGTSVSPNEMDLLLLALGCVFSSVQECQHRRPLHHTGRGISQELAPRLERAVYPNVVLRDHVKIA